VKKRRKNGTTKKRLTLNRFAKAPPANGLGAVNRAPTRGS
jgi:hypothetical protein